MTVVDSSVEVPTFDIVSPYYGPSDKAVDLWVAYQRRIDNRINWRIQLDVQNAFGSKDLIPLNINGRNRWCLPYPRGSDLVLHQHVHVLTTGFGGSEDLRANMGAEVPVLIAEGRSGGVARLACFQASPDVPCVFRSRHTDAPRGHLRDRESRSEEMSFNWI